MDDEQVLRARQVAVAASAWLHAPSDFEVYRRLVLASAAWDAYCAPQFDGQAGDDLAATLRRAARQALRVMDEEAVTLTTNVATAATAWLRPATDGAAFDRLVAAVAAWDDYCIPRLTEPAAEELLDQLGENPAPVSLGEAVEDVTALLRTDVRPSR